MICLYADDCIIFSKTKLETDNIAKELEQLKYYLNMIISHDDGRSYIMSPPLLIKFQVSARNCRCTQL